MNPGAPLRAGGMDDPLILATDRLVMTPHQASDFTDLAAMWRDPQVVRFLGGVPFSDEDSWARLLRYAGNWALLGFGAWALRSRVSGIYLGAAGFLEARRSGVDGLAGDPEIGWTLNVAAQGQGFAGEAVQAALGWGAAAFAGRFGRTVALIHPDNAASVAVARRAGFVHVADARYKDAPTGLWSHSFTGGPAGRRSRGDASNTPP